MVTFEFEPDPSPLAPPPSVPSDPLSPRSRTHPSPPKRRRLLTPNRSLRKSVRRSLSLHPGRVVQDFPRKSRPGKLPPREVVTPDKRSVVVIIKPQAIVIFGKLHACVTEPNPSRTHPPPSVAGLRSDPTEGGYLLHKNLNPSGALMGRGSGAGRFDPRPQCQPLCYLLCFVNRSIFNNNSTVVFFVCLILFPYLFLFPSSLHSSFF